MAAKMFNHANPPVEQTHSRPFSSFLEREGLYLYLISTLSERLVLWETASDRNRVGRTGVPAPSVFKDGPGLL